jgi:hypothetical protein
VKGDVRTAERCAAPTTPCHLLNGEFRIMRVLELAKNQAERALDR